MKHLLNIFLDPGRVFAELKGNPSFWLPLLLLIVVNIALMLTYFGSVDPDWFSEHQWRQMEAQQSGRDLSAAEIEQMKQFMPGARNAGYIATVTTPLFIVIVMLISALYYWLAGKITGSNLSYKQGFTLVAWVSMPGALGIAVALVGALVMSPQTGLESLMLTHLDPLLLQLPLDHAWSRFARTLDLMMLWSIFLGALCWHTWNRTSWAQAIIVAVLPTLVIFGVWALVIVL